MKNAINAAAVSRRLRRVAIAALAFAVCIVAAAFGLFVPAPAAAASDSAAVAHIRLPETIPFALKADGTVVGPPTAEVRNDGDAATVAITTLATAPDALASVRISGPMATFSLGDGKVAFGGEARSVELGQAVELSRGAKATIAISTRDASGRPHAGVSAFATAQTGVKAAIGHLDIGFSCLPQGVEVMLDPNGGACATASINVQVGGRWPVLPRASKAGHTFEGWYTAASGGEKVSAGDAVDIVDEATLYAHYAILVYDVSIDDGCGNLSTVTVNHGDALGNKLPKDPTKDGFEFEAWVDDEGHEVTASTVVTSAMRVTARFRELEAFAVYSADDNSLSFFKRAAVPSVGSKIEGKTATAVYRGIEQDAYASADAVPWSAYRSVIAAVCSYEPIAPQSLAYWFCGCASLRAADLSSWDTAQVANADSLFEGCTTLARVSIGAKWTLAMSACSLPTPTEAFHTGTDGKWYDKAMRVGYAVADIPTGKAATYVVLNLNPGFAVYSATDKSLNFFKRATAPAVGSKIEGKTVTAVYTGIESASYKNDSNVPWSSYARTITTLRTYEPIAPISLRNWFIRFEKITDVSALADWDVSRVSDMDDVFDYCKSLTDISGLANWDTSNVTTMARSFDFCEKVTSLSALANWKTSKVTSMFYTFACMRKLSDISALANWDVSRVTDTQSLFLGNSLLADITPLAGWNTSYVTDMSGMFKETSITSLEPIKNWNVSRVKRMYITFSNCEKLISAPLESWNMPVLTDLEGTFKKCSALADADLSGWNTSKVTSYEALFEGCTKLAKISIGDVWTLNLGTCSLPTPSSSYITGATNRWYDAAAGTAYSSSSIPTKKAATYVAVKP